MFLGKEICKPTVGWLLPPPGSPLGKPRKMDERYTVGPGDPGPPGHPLRLVSAATRKEATEGFCVCFQEAFSDNCSDNTITCIKSSKIAPELIKSIPRQGEMARKHVGFFMKKNHRQAQSKCCD